MQHGPDSQTEFKTDQAEERVITTAKLPQLDRCECGHDFDQHFHTTRSTFHSGTREDNEIHAQANLAL
eukprot:1905100-Prorocentrum_lima.AAC.1